MCARRQGRLPIRAHLQRTFVDKSGAPLKGPLALNIEFFDASVSGNQKGGIFSYSAVALDDGIFQLTIALSASDFNTVFDGTGSTWMQVTDTSNNKVYPRLRMFAVPYALKVPVDNTTVGYDASGRLTVLESSAAGTQLISAINNGSGTISTSVLPTLAGDVSGSATTNKVTKIQNVPVAPPGGGDSGRYLQYNGTGFVLAAIASSSGGTVTSVTVNAPLIAAGNTGISPTLSLGAATGSADGYLSSSDWIAFNSKPGALSAASSSQSGYLTAADWASFNGKQSALGFIPLNKAGDSMSGPLTMNEAGELRFTPAGSTNYVGLKAPSSVVASVTWTLPFGDGAGGQFLSTNGSGTLAWMNAPAPVTSVVGRSGAVTLTTGDVAEGSSLYYNDARARAALAVSSPLSYNNATGALAMSAAANGANGYLTSTDWGVFNTKQPAGNYLTALTGDISASGSGSVGATLAPSLPRELTQRSLSTPKGAYSSA